MPKKRRDILLENVKKYLKIPPGFYVAKCLVRLEYYVVVDREKKEIVLSFTHLFELDEWIQKIEKELPPPKKLLKTYKQVCLICKKEFIAHHAAIRLCSSECRKIRRIEITTKFRKKHVHMQPN